MVYLLPRVLRLALLVCLSTASVWTVLAQATPPTADQLQAEANKVYAKRLTQEKIDGHYIPRDVLDAMRELDKITSTSSQAAYASRPEDFVVKKLYFSFGRWLGVNWGLYDGSRLSAHLRDMGVDQPDGQIDLLMRLYHRHLTDKELGVKDLAEAFKENKARNQAARLSRGAVLDSFTRPGTPPPGGNPPRG